MYGVLLLRQNITLDILGQKVEVPLSFTKGMIGVIPVFENLEDALEYADGNKELTFKLEEVK